MTWAAGIDRTTGALISAADWNKYLGITGSIMETAPAKVTTAGDLVVGTGANAIGRLAAVAAGQVLTSQGVGVAPAWAAPGGPSCRVYNSTSQSIPTNTTTTLTFDSELFDPFGMHSTSSNTSRITMPTAGVYAVGANIEFSAGANTYIITFMVNGTTQIGAQYAITNAGLPTAFTVTVPPWKFAAGDYVEVRVYQTSGSTFSVNGSGAPNNYRCEFAAAWLAQG